MTEAYLHYIWQHRLFEAHQLCTTSGEPIKLINGGFYNHNAGPDFLEARLKIGDKEWAGHVEIHVAASDWLQHNHQQDPAYDNVILHVVYDADKPVKNASGFAIPTLQLKGRFDDMGYWRYEQFIGNKQFIPCAAQLKPVDDFLKANVLDRCLVERLEDKAQFVLNILAQTKGDWQTTFYRVLFYAFGLKVNAQSMLALAQRLPENILQKHQNNPFQIEALVFGCSGLVQNQDEYAKNLKGEFNFLSKKYSLVAMQPTEWKFARMRPAGFPTVRLAQLVEVLKNTQNIFRHVVDAADLSQCKSLLKQNLPSYWQTHYRFGKESPSKEKRIADSFVDLVLINAIIPTIYNYGQTLSKPALKERALGWLEQLKPEKNRIVNQMRTTGFSISSAHASQGALQLYKSHCSLRKCLSCAIGVNLLKQ